MSVAVIIASCNREQQAFATAQSLLDAGMNEVIVIDDGSTTPYQICETQEGISLFRLAVNSGPSVARNLGANRTEAEWLIFLDDDDSLDPKLYQWIRNNTHNTLKFFDLVHFGYKTIEQASKIKSADILSENDTPSVLSGSWMMRRNFFININGYEENLKYSENSDLIDRAITNKARTLHAGFSTLLYSVGRPQRREEMAERRAQACLFYLKHRPHCDRKKMLKIGLMNSWWCKNTLLSLHLIIAFFNKIKY